MTYRLVVDGNLFSRKGVFNDNLLASTINTSIINGYGDRTMNMLTLGNNTNIVNFGSSTTSINFVGTNTVTGPMTINGDITVNGVFNLNSSSSFTNPNNFDFKNTTQNVSIGINQDDGTYINLGNPTKSNLNTNIYGNKTQISLNNNNCIETNTGTNYSYIDFHSSNSTIDYDSRISCEGGNNAVVGQGVMSILGYSLDIPNTTDVYSRGSTANLFTNQTTGGNVIIGSTTTNTTLQGDSLVVPNNISSTTKSSPVELFTDQTSGGNITIGNNNINTIIMSNNLSTPNQIGAINTNQDVNLFTDQNNTTNIYYGVPRKTLHILRGPVTQISHNTSSTGVSPYLEMYSSGEWCGIDFHSSDITESDYDGRIICYKPTTPGTYQTANMCLMARNVGIGTITPVSALHVHESTGTEGDATSGSITISHGNAGGKSSIVFKHATDIGSDYGYIRYNDDINGSTTQNTARLEIGTENDGKGTGNNYDALILQKNGGYIGIGNSNPTYRLDVSGTTLLRNGGNGSAYNNIQMLFGYGDNRYMHSIGSRHNSVSDAENSIDFHVWKISDGINTVGSKHVMSLNTTGVGIGGVNTPSYALDIKNSYGIGGDNTPFIRLSGNGNSGNKVGIHLSPAYGRSGGESTSIMAIDDGSFSGHITFWTASPGTGNGATTETERMRITSSGNVGIGKTNPSYALDVNGVINLTQTSGNAWGAIKISPATDGAECALGFYQNANNTGATWAIGSGGTTLGNDKFGIASSTLSGVPFVITNAGRIGIGTATPICPLQVKGTGTLASYSYGYLTNSGTTGASSIGSGGIAITLHATDGRAVLGEVNVVSDERIKNNIKLITNPLDTIKLLEPVTYNHIDLIKNNKLNYGFIAQKIEKILPDIVNIENSYIPNIYCKVICQKNKLIIEKNYDISINDSIKLYDISNTEIIVKVNDIIDKNIIIDKELNNSEYFLYGKEVNDFRNVEKNAIFTIGISAIKELDKIVEKQQETINKQNEEILLLKEQMEKIKILLNLN